MALACVPAVAGTFASNDDGVPALGGSLLLLASLRLLAPKPVQACLLFLKSSQC